MNWTTIISVFGGSIAFFSAAAWLAKSLVSHFLKKDVETYKAQLQFDQSLMMEKFRADLEKVSLEHQVKFSKLHEKRAEVIAELYSLIVLANDAIESCLEAFQAKKKQASLANTATQRGDELANHITFNKIYFSLALSRELDELSVCLIDAAISYKFYCEDSPKKESWENIESLLSEATIDASSALRIAEAEFRELLGVEPNTDENSKPR
jgi:hypothetical protein